MGTHAFIRPSHYHRKAISKNSMMMMTTSIQFSLFTVIMMGCLIKETHSQIDPGFITIPAGFGSTHPTERPLPSPTSTPQNVSGLSNFGLFVAGFTTCVLFFFAIKLIKRHLRRREDDEVPFRHLENEANL